MWLLVLSCFVGLWLSAVASTDSRERFSPSHCPRIVQARLATFQRHLREEEILSRTVSSSDRLRS